MRLAMRNPFLDVGFGAELPLEARASRDGTGELGRGKRTAATRRGHYSTRITAGKVTKGLHPIRQRDISASGRTLFISSVGWSGPQCVLRTPSKPGRGCREEARFLAKHMGGRCQVRVLMLRWKMEKAQTRAL
jgi:hypothetical protein